MHSVARRYILEFGLAMLGYTLLLPLSILVIDDNQPVALRALLAALPALPLVFAFRAYLRFLQGSDELQQRIQLQAVAVAAGVTGLSTFTYGLLETNAGFPPLPVLWVFPLLITLWGLATALLNWRYR